MSACVFYDGYRHECRLSGSWCDQDGNDGACRYNKDMSKLNAD